MIRRFVRLFQTLVWAAAATILIAASLPARSQEMPPTGTMHGIKYHEYSAMGVPNAETAHVWGQWHRLYNYANEGDNVTQYLQHYGFGNSHVFGQVVEVQQWQRKGNAWGIEVDLMTPPNRDVGYRVGVGVVLGPTGLTSQATPGYATHGFALIPFAGYHASVKYGLYIDVPCEQACISIPSGQSIEFTNDEVVGQMKFDPKTGILGMWRRDGLLIWGIQQETGEEYRMRRFD